MDKLKADLPGLLCWLPVWAVAWGASSSQAITGLVILLAVTAMLFSYLVKDETEEAKVAHPPLVYLKPGEEITHI